MSTANRLRNKSLIAKIEHSEALCLWVFLESINLTFSFPIGLSIYRAKFGIPVGQAELAHIEDKPVCAFHFIYE